MKLLLLLYYKFIIKIIHFFRVANPFFLYNYTLNNYVCIARA